MPLQTDMAYAAYILVGFFSLCVVLLLVLVLTTQLPASHTPPLPAPPAALRQTTALRPPQICVLSSHLLGSLNTAFMVKTMQLAAASI